MTKPRKKRYHNAQQILEEIDLYKIKMQKLNNAAMALEMKADMLKKDGHGMEGEIHYAQSEALRYRNAATRIQEKRLPLLKSKLGEFLTPQLPTIDNGDKSIPA